MEYNLSKVIWTIFAFGAISFQYREGKNLTETQAKSEEKLGNLSADELIEIEIKIKIKSVNMYICS